MATVAVQLVAMTDEDYAAYAATSREDYAQQIAESGSLSVEDAMAKAEADYATLLPEGHHTPGQHLWTAVVEGVAVGLLWMRLDSDSRGPRAYVYDVSVREEQRGRGYGRAIMTAGEDFCRERGVLSIGLNVFGPNTVARTLYEHLGYDVTSVQMRKEL